MFHYSIYGQPLVSDIPLPELEQRAAAAVASVPLKVNFVTPERAQFTGVDWLLRSRLAGDSSDALCGKIEGGYLLRYTALADFIVDRLGNEIRCIRVEPDTSPATLRHLLLDRVLPLILNLRGCHVLHATAVLTSAGVCAFIGPAGAGKSTLAAGLYAAGLTPFVDDCLVVQLNDNILATPGYAGLRLWPDSLAALGYVGFEAGRLNEQGKFRLATRSSCQNPDKLLAVYRVCRAAEHESEAQPWIEPLRGREAFMELVAASFVLDITDRLTVSRHFHFIEQLIQRVHIRRVHVPNKFSLLAAASRAILDDLAQS